MNSLAVVLYLVLGAMYLAVTIGYGVRFVRRGEVFWPYWKAERVATILLHAMFLGALGAAHEQWPMAGPACFCSLIALGLALVHTVLELRFRSGETGVFFFALALIFQLASWPAVTSSPATNELLQNPVFGIHVAAALLGYVAFLVSALYGLLHLGLYQMLKTRRFGLFFDRMPPLDLLAKMNLHAVLVGFGCLTLALALGITLSVRLEVPSLLGDAKFVQSAAAWFLYGLLLAARYGMGLRGRPLVVLSIVCFALLAVSTGVVHFLPTFHNFP